jgi:hypothetical protein
MSVAVPVAGQGGSRLLDMDEHRPPFRGDAASPTAPTMAQDQAVIGWLATRPALPDLTRDLLIDVLIFWQSLAPLPVVTAEPSSGPVVDVREQLHAVTRRLSAHPCHPDDHQTQMVLADLHCLLGLAWYSLLDPGGARDGRRRWEQHLDCMTCLRVLETDTAVELALADLRRERGE